MSIRVFGKGSFYDKDVFPVAQAHAVEITSQILRRALPKRVIGLPQDIDGYVLAEDFVEKPSRRGRVSPASDVQKNQGPRSPGRIDAANAGF